MKNHNNKTEKGKKHNKNNLYTTLKSNITENSSEEEEEKEHPIKIYYKEKIATINININEPFSNFLNTIKDKFKIVDFEKKFEIFYNHKEIPLTDGRLLIEIIRKEIEKEEEDIVFELREKFTKNISYKDKLYIELENVPSFMDLTTQIAYFISTQNKVVDYELNYSNNIYNLLFSSNQIGFSFVSFMSNLKFTNKYYRKLKIDIHYNTIEKLRFGHSDDIEDKDKYKNKMHSPLGLRRGLNISYKSKHKKSKSYGNIFKYNLSNEEYNFNNNNFINDSIPYEQEKLIKRFENVRDRKKWMNLKGFFTSANIQSFNSLISPKKKIRKIIINANEKKSKVLHLNNIKINE